jgi:murein DD-endopeptidase MepM/ murein hydrolase activator NlpD
MTRRSLTCQALLCQRSLWLQGLSWVVGLSVLSGSGVLAQDAIDQLPINRPVQPVNRPALAPRVAPVAPSIPQPAVSAAPRGMSPSSAVPDAGVSSGDANSFIDRTDYSVGATQRYEQPVIIAQPEQTAPSHRPSAWSSRDAVSVAPVQVGPIRLSSSGIGWNSGSSGESSHESYSPVGQAYNSVGQAYSTVKAYYNRTVRPLGQAGNGDIKLLFPLSLPAPITSLFGWRVHPITGNSRFHSGTDLGAPLGTPVLAALTGRVIMADFFGGYGLAIALEHGQGTQQTLYGHLSEVFVKPGDIVQQGAAIGRVGSTGASTGPHLHFEFRQETTEGWVAMDAGLALESAMAELVKSMQVAATPKAEQKSASTSIVNAQ